MEFEWDYKHPSAPIIQTQFLIKKQPLERLVHHYFKCPACQTVFLTFSAWKKHLDKQ